MTTQQFVLASPVHPTMDNFQFTAWVDLPELKREILLKGMYYSVDPYMRGRMNDTKSYVLTFEIDKPR
jgi:NADPH-dependent curcumin reductase CurA